jgi:hypothetical protein
MKKKGETMVVGLLRYIDRDVCRHSAPDTKVRTYSAWQGPELLMLFTDVVVDNLGRAATA